VAVVTTASAAAPIRGHPYGGSLGHVYAGCVPGQWELIALVFVVLVLFGSKQLPQLARQLGRGLREVKDTVADVDPREQVKRAMETKPIEAPDDESSAER
jgi:TatA/E family protein of Tat protein translocase